MASNFQPDDNITSLPTYLYLPTCIFVSPNGHAKHGIIIMQADLNVI